MTGSLNMDNQRINSCRRLTMYTDGNSPIVMNNSRIYGLPNPTGTQQPVTLGFGDNRYFKA